MIVPVTLFVIFILIYINSKSFVETSIVLLSVPFALIGSVWLMFLLDYNVSTAVWVGAIALSGLAAGTSVLMLVYLNEAYEDSVKRGEMNNMDDLYATIMHGAVQRVRPKMMTVATTTIGLLPLMWSTGTGADMMKRIAAPMVGGLVTSAILTLVIIPVIFAIWKEWEMGRR